MLCGAGFVAFFSSTISKSPVLPLFATHLGGDAAAVGMIASVSAFAGIIMSIPAGILADRFGRRTMLIMASLVFASAPFLYLMVDSIYQLAAVRLYHGIATAVFLPVAMALVASSYSEARGEKMGWFSTSTLLGRFLAPVAGGTILGIYALDAASGFIAVYVLCGIAGIATMVMALNIPGSIEVRRPGSSWRETLSVTRTVLTSKAVIVTCIVEAGILFAYGTFEAFLPLYALSKGLTAYHAGILLSSQVIVLALTKPVMGRFSDRHGRRPQIIAGAFLGAVCIGAFSVSGSFLLFLALSIAFGLCLSVVTSASSALIADLCKAEGHGAAMGTLGSIMDVGQTTGPLVAGFVAAASGLAHAFMAASIALALSGLLFTAYSMTNSGMLSRTSETR